MTWEPVKEMVSCYIPWSATNTGFCYLTFLHTDCSTVKLFLYVEVEAETGNVVQTSSTWWRYTENGSNDINPKPFCFHKPSSANVKSVVENRHHIKECEESICQSTWKKNASYSIQLDKSLCWWPNLSAIVFFDSVAKGTNKGHHPQANRYHHLTPQTHRVRYLMIWISAGYNLKILNKWWTK